MNILGLNITRSQRREASAAKQETGASVPSRVVYSNRGNALQVSAFYHALDLRAGSFARAKTVIERYNPVKNVWESDIKNMTFAQHIRHLQYLLDVRPNSRMTATQFKRTLSLIRDIEGCAAIYMVRDGMDVYQLIPCCGVSHNDIDDTYNLTSRDYNKSWTGVDSKDVILLRGTSTENRPLGESLVHIANRELTLQLTATDLITKVYGKGGTFRAIVKQEGGADPMSDLTAFNDVEVEKNTESIQEKWNKGDDFVYDPSASQITPVSQSFQDLQISIVQNATTEGIGRICNVPIPLMFSSNNAVYKSADDAFHTFVQLYLVPFGDQFIEELNAKYLGEDNYGILRFRFDVTALCLDSENIKATTAASRRSAGITTANEERAYMGLPAVEGGDEINKPQTPQPPLGGAGQGEAAGSKATVPSGSSAGEEEGGAK